MLFNRRPNETQSGDNGLRLLPPRSPGTPRHPAYPSGHSTTYAAGGELLAAFFPDLRAEFEQLADNAGVARLWAGIHYRSDHLWGMELGRCVAQHVIVQLRRNCICPPDPCNPPDPCQHPPSYAEVKKAAAGHRDCCREHADLEPFHPPDGAYPGQLPQLDPAEQPEVGLDDEEDDRGTDTHGAGA